MKPTCPFCGAELPAWGSIAKHLWQSPCGKREVCGSTISFGRTGRRGLRSIICWCGWAFSLRKKHGSKSWAAHIKAVGGLANHILELTIGEQR